MTVTEQSFIPPLLVLAGQFLYSTFLDSESRGLSTQSRFPSIDMKVVQSKRESARARVQSNEQLDKILHWFVMSVLLINMLLIIYTVLSISVRMTLAHNGFLDSLPLALYIIPLVIVIPILLRSYNESRAALFPLIIVLISTLILGVLSSLVRGFTFVIGANTFCAATVIIMGRFRVSGQRGNWDVRA